MERTVIKATRRTVTGKQVKTLRRQGSLPGVLYGHHTQPIAISLDAHSTERILAGTSSSTVITIDLEGEEHAVLVREKQKDYIKNNLVHVDFQVVSLTEKIHAAVRIEIHGLSPAVKDFNAVIVTNVSQVEVEAFPQDLPERLVVDVSKLTAIGDAIYVRDLVISDKVTLFTSVDEVVVVATGAAPEVEEGEGADVAEPEVIERGKKEDEE